MENDNKYQPSTHDISPICSANKMGCLLSIIEKLSQVMLRADEWSRVKESVISACCELVQAEVCAIYLKDETGNALYLDAGAGYQHRVADRRISYRLGTDPKGSDADGVTGWIAQTGSAVRADTFEEVRSLPGWKGKWDNLLWDSKPQNLFRGMLGVPLKINDNEVIGVLKVENKRSPDGSCFDQEDEVILKTVAASIASATQVYRHEVRGKDMAYRIVVNETMSSLRPFDYVKQMVTICKELLNTEVCALYLRGLNADPHRLVLVAGEGYKQSIRPGSLTYAMGNDPEGSDASGVTSWVAQTGKEAWANSYDEVRKLPGWKGKWDQDQWKGHAENFFHCMFAVPLKYQDNVIGVLKIENKRSNPSQFTEEDRHAMRVIAQTIGNALYEKLQADMFLRQLEQLDQIGEFEYRLPRFKENTFDKRFVGDIIVRHNLTSICPSDVAYFHHKKNRKKLDDRLPMVLGHETTGTIAYIRDTHYYSNEPVEIKKGDRVVVIPLIHCEQCEICKGGYGENYCPSSRFMASDAPGSLRSQYKYYPELVLKIPDSCDDTLALFTEPMSTVVQALIELGFTKNSYSFPLIFKQKQSFPYFHVPAQSFTNIFNTITSEEPNPRTTYFMAVPDSIKKDIEYPISVYNLLKKGLAIYGGEPPEVNQAFSAKSPKVLIMGDGPIGYLMALVLSKVYGLARDQITVIGNHDSHKLRMFDMYSDNLYAWQNFKDIGKISSKLLEKGEFDATFICVGNSMKENISISANVLRPQGVIGIIGLTEDNIPINFSQLTRKQIYLKGFWRGSLESYKNSLSYISEIREVAEGLDRLIDRETEINNEKGIHTIFTAEQLAEVFEKVNTKEAFGRLIVRLI